MKKYSFVKMNGAGNDFILFDKNSEPTINLTVQQIQKLCDRKYGVGADGLMLIEKADDFDFRATYYNSDGSGGILCGNGARCIIKFAHLTKKISDGRARFLFNDVEYSGEVVSEDEIKFYFNPPTKIKSNFKLKEFGQLFTANYVDTGAPHVVIKINDVLINPKNLNSSYKDLSQFPVFEFGRAIRYHKDFEPIGANVNFIDVKENCIYIRTYERGVEDETNACGTGSVATAIIANIIDGLKPPVTLITKGNEKLLVDYKIENGEVINLSLTGPAKINFYGEIEESFFN